MSTPVCARSKLSVTVAARGERERDRRGGGEGLDLLRPWLLRWSRRACHGESAWGQLQVCHGQGLAGGPAGRVGCARGDRDRAEPGWWCCRRPRRRLVIDSAAGRAGASPRVNAASRRSPKSRLTGDRGRDHAQRLAAENTDRRRLRLSKIVEAPATASTHRGDADRRPTWNAESSRGDRPGAGGGQLEEQICSPGLGWRPLANSWRSPHDVPGR